MKLTFCHPEFEQKVRERLNVFDRDLTNSDALLIKELDSSSHQYLHEILLDKVIKE